MVATKSAFARAGAVGVTALFLLTLFPAAPVQAQVAPAPGDISVVQGQAFWTQTTFAGGNRATSFIDDGTGESTLHVPVYNVGAPIENVPVYYQFKEVTETECRKIDLPAGTAAQPGMGWANFTINTRDLPRDGAFNVTVTAFPPAAPPGASECSTTLQNPTSRPSTAGAECVEQGVTCRTEVTPDNNAVNAYLIKNRFLNLHVREIKWCEGEFRRDTVAPCDTDMLNADGTVYNATPPYNPENGDPTYTYFEVLVEALPGDNAWQDLIDYGGNNSGGSGLLRDGFEYHLNVTVRGANITTVLNLSWDETTGNGTLEDNTVHRARSTRFQLDGKAGIYNVTAKVDPQRSLRRHGSDTSIDTAMRDVEVAYHDFTGNFTPTDFRTSATNPYPYDGPGHIRGNVTFRNVGTAPLTSNDRDIAYRVYLDNLTSPLFTKEGTIASLGDMPVGDEAVDNEFLLEIDFEYTSTLSSSFYLPPGKHTLIAEIDAAVDQNDGAGEDIHDALLESNETNNTFTLEIYVIDDSTPQFANTPKITRQISSLGVNAPAIAESRPLEPFNIHINVTDDDNELKVVANFTLDSDPSINRTFPATKTPTRYVAQVYTFNYHNFTNRSANGQEAWTLRVVATDSFGNVAVSAAQPFQLKPWEIHSASAEALILQPDWPSANLSYESTAEPTWRIRVLPNMTGFTGEGHPNQQFYRENLFLNVSAPSSDASLNGSFWQALTPQICSTESDRPTQSGPGLPTVPGGGGVGSCTPTEEEQNNTFRTSVAKRSPGGLGPGLWNYSVMVKDIANHTRIVNGTLHVVDDPPNIREANLSVGANATITPGANFRVEANISDDDNIVDAYVNFTRALDGVFVNFTLVNGTDLFVDTTTDYRVWNDTITTGRGKMLGLGGNFTVSVHAVDGAGNWNRSELGTILIADSDIPQIDAGSFGVVPGGAEIGENVTFWAKVRDSTNVTVKLNIFRAAGSDEVFETRMLEEGLDGNFTTTLNFTAEAVHGWELIPEDSVKNTGDKKTGTLIVSDNFGPKFEVRSPDVVIDGTRYGSATPRIDLVVFDVEGVVSSSIDMKVAGQPVNFQVLDAPGNLNGYLVSYTVPANRKFEHLDVVDVNLTARDNSSESLLGHLNFSFVIDDVAPRARLVSVSPSYRDQPAHPLNVSLASRFTLAAEDVDNLPTDVASIRYRIIGGGPGGPETVYSGPFRLNDAPGVYTGPRIYQVQFWAEDAVGNSGQRQANATTVYVDDAAPALFQFFPQPRTVNATFLDDRVGVNNSVIWLRVNDAPYQPQELSEIDGTWRTTLPAGRLGDRISYYLQVWDKLGNTETYGNQTNPYHSFDVSNQEPAIRIVTPVEGARVGRSVELTWDASEPDEQALVFKLFVKKPGSAAFTELREFTDSARRAFVVDLSDVTSYRDGEYTLRVTASDGAFVSVDDVTVTLIRSTNPLGELGVQIIGDAIPGETLLIKAQITKAEAIVVARLYLGDVLVGNRSGYPMNDEGRDGDEVAGDGFYSTRVTIDDAGDYRVEIFTQYREDGVIKEDTIESAKTFNAKLTPGYVLSKFGAIIAIIGLLAAVGIGVAVFVVMRRR